MNKETPEMKTLNDYKDEVAKIEGYEDWATLLMTQQKNGIHLMFVDNCANQAAKAYANQQTLSQSELLAEVIEALEQCLYRIDKKSKDTWDIKARFVAESALQKYKSTKS